MSDTGSIDIEYVAKLARLDLTDAEKVEFAGQLNGVLNHFQQLSEVNVDGVEPMAHAFPVYNVLQKDEEGPTFTQEEALMNAPAQRDNQVVVPKVVDGA